MTMTREFKRGVKAAADIADSYNGTSTHRYRLGDCILLKLNAVTRNKPRINRKAQEDSIDSWTRGAAMALAEMHRRCHDDIAVRIVARECGVTIGYARRCHAPEYDLRELKRAGVR